MTTTSSMVTISEKAKNALARLRQEEGKPENSGIRVSVTGGGCSGLSYQLDFETDEQPGDHIFEDKSIKVYVNAKSLLYLVGTELDFSDGLNGKGFFFNNPNASRTCACGESFAV